MALILHLSDLHLTGSAHPVPIADHKAEVVAKGEAGTRTKLLASSLFGLGEELRKNDETLDSVIISGDISDAGRSEGYDELPSILAELGKTLPPNNRILIVPGNHDVDRAVVGSDRFARIRKLRDAGYLVGWLSEAEIQSEEAPVLRGADSSYVIVGINSSYYSGSTLATDGELSPFLPALEKAALSDKGVQSLLKAWRERGKADLSRVSDKELAALHSKLGVAAVDGTGPLRIVALHHQLIPVSTNEEIKPFESMSNLGHFRRWLESNAIDLVLHGHKHTDRILRDRIDSGAPGRPHDLTIMSAPSIVNARGADDLVGQLIRISPAVPRHSGYEVILVPAVESGTTRALEDMPRRTQPLHEQAALGVLEGDDVDAVYAKIQAVASRVDELPTPLVCRVKDGASALALPLNMADVPAPGTERDRWLDTVIKWWQRKEPGRAASFNHGQFLHLEGRHKLSAVARIEEELRDGRGSSRALAVLVSQDTMQDNEEFPSFITLQFVARGDRIDAVAYFRKQELLHWWPINLVEIAQIQRDVVGRMTNRKQWKCGSITTVTAMPVADSEMPTVAVPKLDLLIDDPGGLLKLVLPLFTSPADESDPLSLWKEHFDDWVPKDAHRSAAHTLPRLGLQELADTVTAASQSYPSSVEIDRLIREITSLVRINRRYEEDVHAEWAEEAREQSVIILAQVQKVLEARCI